MTDLTFGTDKETPGVVGNGEKFMLYVEKELMLADEYIHRPVPYP